MEKQRIVDILRNGQPDESVLIQGWVRTKRDLKGFAFIEVNDGSSLANLQVVLKAEMPDYEALLKQLNTGTSVEVTGVLVPSQGKGQRIELQAQTVEVYGEVDPETYPLQKKRHSFEFLRTIGHLRSRTNSSKNEAFCGFTHPSSPKTTVKALENCSPSRVWISNKFLAPKMRK